MASTEYDVPPGERPVSGWAVGGFAFAASMLTLVGIFQIIDGLAAIINDQFIVKAQHYAFNVDTTAWGWIHLVLGILVLWTGISLFRGAEWAAVGAIAIAMLQAIVNFFYIPYYPVWALVIIGLDIWVIWALSRPGVVGRN